MTSPQVHTARDENSMAPTHAKHAVSNTANLSKRSPLANVSPNPKAATSYAHLKGSKPMAGSPLKRSFTAMTDRGDGFKYLKRRRLSEEETLSQVDGPVESVRQSLDRELEVDAAAAGRFRPSAQSHAEGPYYLHRNTEPNAPSPSPTEPNTPPSEESNHNSQGSSGDRASFSSLINYDPSSQAAGLPQRPQSSSGLVFKRVSHAEMLVLKLRVAMYKVRTNQIDVPFEELRLEGEDRPWSAPAPSVEEVVAARRRDAYLNEPAAAQPFPKLLPAPALKPTAYSSRFVYDDSVLPSSPPLVPRQDGSMATMGGEAEATPRAARRGEWERSSPRFDEAGSVAEGLLGLRNSS